MEDVSPRRSGSFWFWLAAAGLASLVLAASLLGPGSGPHAVPGASPAVGKSLLEFRLQPLLGADAELGLDDLKGRVSVVNFWGTWCPPCRIEFPHLVELRHKLKDRPDFQLLPVSCGGGRDDNLAALREETEAFLRQQGFELPIYADRDAWTRMAFDELLGYQGLGYPATLVLDRGGKIRGVWVGYREGDERDVETLVTTLLGGDA